MTVENSPIGSGLTTALTDMDYLIHKLLRTEYGDANLDSKVNFADYLVMTQNWGSSGVGWAEGDFNGDTSVGFADYLLLSNNFGFGGE